MDNRVFFQHPDLMRQLCVHETVMQLMVNTLNKAQLQQQASAGAAPQDPNASQVANKAPHSSMDALTESSKVRHFDAFKRVVRLTVCTLSVLYVLLCVL
jgi:hypothetical protein